MTLVLAGFCHSCYKLKFLYHNEVCILCCVSGTVYKQKWVDAKLKTGKDVKKQS